MNATRYEAYPGTSRRNIIEVSGREVNIDDDGLCQVASATQEPADEVSEG